jgi:two-component system sensor histidine kinase HydH
MADLLSRKASQGASKDEIQELVERLQMEASRLENTVARFLEFARTPDLNPEPMELSAPLSEAAGRLKPMPQIHGKGLALADPRAFSLICSVLFSNACEAAGKEGKVRAELGEAGSQTVLNVWDSGAPIPESERSRLFTPFFTTKPKGLGLGLATAAGLASAMRGKLSLLDDGKTFELRLPKP